WIKTIRPATQLTSTTVNASQQCLFREKAKTRPLDPKRPKFREERDETVIRSLRAAERKGNRSTRAATRVTRRENRASAPALRWRRARTLATAARLHAGLRIGG